MITNQTVCLNCYDFRYCFLWIITPSHERSFRPIFLRSVKGGSGRRSRVISNVGSSTTMSELNLDSSEEQACPMNSFIPSRSSTQNSIWFLNDDLCISLIFLSCEQRQNSHHFLSFAILISCLFAITLLSPKFLSSKFFPPLFSFFLPFFFLFSTLCPCTSSTLFLYFPSIAKKATHTKDRGGGNGGLEVLA